MHGSLHPLGPDVGTMTMVGPYVDPQLRRHKFATMMLERCLKVANGLGQDFVTTDASTRTPELEAFLKQNSFHISRASNRIDLRDVRFQAHSYTRSLKQSPAL